MERFGPFYVRYMDDVLVLAPSRWKLTKAVKTVNAVLGVAREPEYQNLKLSFPTFLSDQKK